MHGHVGNMMRFKLSELEQHPDLWHALIPLGVLDGTRTALLVDVPSGLDTDGLAGEIVEPPLPSLPRMALNAAGAAGRASFAALRGKPVFVPDEVEAIRLALCHVCPNWRQTDRRCALCGCWTEAVFARKAKLATERCPVGHWERWEPAKLF